MIASVCTSNKMSDTGSTKQIAKRYLTALRSLLSDLYEQTVTIASVNLSGDGSVSGIFSSDKELFDFSVSPETITYKLRPKPRRLDTQSVSYLQTLSSIPMPLAKDSYSMGFLQVWHQDTRTKRKPSICRTGIRCKGTCIAQGDQCRISVNSPLTKKKVNDLVKAGKVINTLGGSELLIPLLGAAAIGLVGFSAGLTVGSYLGAQAAAKPPVRTRPQATPPQTEKKPRKTRFKEEDIPDPWEG